MASRAHHPKTRSELEKISEIALRQHAESLGINIKSLYINAIMEKTAAIDQPSMHASHATDLKSDDDNTEHEYVWNDTPTLALTSLHFTIAPRLNIGVGRAILGKSGTENYGKLERK